MERVRAESIVTVRLGELASGVRLPRALDCSEASKVTDPTVFEGSTAAEPPPEP